MASTLAARSRVLDKHRLHALSKRGFLISQVRWESTSRPSALDGEAKRTSGSSGSAGSGEAAMLLLRKNKQSADQQQISAASNRQTVRPPSIPSDAQKISGSPRPSAHQKQAASAAKREPAATSTANRSSQLTSDEEAKLGEMRHAQDEIKDQLLGILKHFDAPIRYAFAYGSGVYKQTGYGSESKPMVDLIFAVSHPDHWHALNINQNRSHYSFMGSLGSDAVAMVQSRIGAGVYYNPFVEIDGVVIKYGVVSMDTLSSDLLNWDTLYLAGRMHKPTLTLRRDPLMRISKQVNLTHAVRAALLMLPKNFSSTDLFRTIASLSFAGDIRMKIGGENPRKVENIVEAQMPLFKSRYASIIEGLPNLEYIGQDLLQQDMGPTARAAMVRKMPNSFYSRLVKQGRKAGISLPPGLGAETVNTEKLVVVEDIPEITSKAVESIVARPALTQSAKGLLTSGFSKSISYMYAKNSKYRRG
ncbi:Mmp37-domain-containing protein [Martensiomyces pterosporus]|nr:Mmp37-domain-containing protein [Martensiomyces pterosporus]